MEPAGEEGEQPRLRIAYVMNNVAFFASHRLPLAKAARERGYEPCLMAGTQDARALQKKGEAEVAAERIPYRCLRFHSSSVNPLTEFRGLWDLVRVLRSTRPALVHCASPKGNLYGALAARLARTPALVLAISGQGYLHTGQGAQSFRKAFLRRTADALCRVAFAHPNKRVIVQNHDDRADMLGQGLARENEVVLIPGSGVDLASFRFVPMAQKRPQVLFPARMLEDKGLLEFVEAARRLKVRYPDWRFILAGTADSQNPSSVPPERILQWQAQGHVEWRGHVDDMARLYAETAITCLPSHREGMPKALLEAAAAGCAIVTTDAIGCREAIDPDRTGFLVPVGDVDRLEAALGRLLEDDLLRTSFGQRGRRLAEERFSIEHVIESTMSIYADLLRGKASGG